MLGRSGRLGCGACVASGGGWDCKAGTTKAGASKAGLGRCRTADIDSVLVDSSVELRRIVGEEADAIGVIHARSDALVARGRPAVLRHVEGGVVVPGGEVGGEGGVLPLPSLAVPCGVGVRGGREWWACEVGVRRWPCGGAHLRATHENPREGACAIPTPTPTPNLTPTLTSTLTRTLTLAPTLTLTLTLTRTLHPAPAPHRDRDCDRDPHPAPRLRATHERSLRSPHGAAKSQDDAARGTRNSSVTTVAAAKSAQ